jgi:hypothetical protein
MKVGILPEAYAWSQHEKHVIQEEFHNIYTRFTVNMKS